MIFHRRPKYQGTTGVSVLPPFRPGAAAPAPAPAPRPMPFVPAPAPAPLPPPPFQPQQRPVLAPPMAQPVVNPNPAPVVPVTTSSIDSMISALDAYAQAMNAFRTQAAASLDNVLLYAISIVTVLRRRLQQRRGMGTPNGSNAGVVLSLPQLQGGAVQNQINSMNALAKAARSIGAQIPFTDVSSRLQGLSLMLQNQATRLKWQTPGDTAYIGR